MPFTIIKKGQTLPGVTPPPKKTLQRKGASQPTRPARKEAVARQEKLLFGVVGHKHRKDGSVQLIRSSVPESEASSWLKAEHQLRHSKKGT